MVSDLSQRLLTLVVGTLLVTSLFAGVASAQSGIGGTTVVERGETISSINGVYGTIVVEGTVTGDVSGVAGNVVVRQDGVVEGNVDGAAGNVRIAGTVQGDLSAGAGSIQITETGVVEGNVDVGAGDVRIDGTINGDAKIGADTIRLGETATIRGSLTYDGNLQGNRDAVQGEITRDRSLSADQWSELRPVAEWIFAVNAFVLNLLLGVLLLGLFPNFSDHVADGVTTDPAKSGLVGVGVFLGIPILLVLVAITLVGIPIAIAGLIGFLVFSWMAVIYGRFAVGTWLLSYIDVDNRWVALVVGLVLAVIIWQIPVVGGLVNFVIYLLGLGALVTALARRRRQLSPGDESADVGETTPAD